MFHASFIKMEPTFTCVSSSLLVVQIIEFYKKKTANHSCFFCPSDIIYEEKKIIGTGNQ